MIFINFKSNLRSAGENAIRILGGIKAAQKETKVTLVVAPHDLDIFSVSKEWGGQIWAQHADYDRGTGRNQVELLKEWYKGKISGVFLNHSEHKYEGWNLLAKVVRECGEYNFKTLLFAGSETEIAKILEMQLKPTYLAYEPPELVGSQETSVSKEKPEVISKVAKLLKGKDIPLIVGAGVKDVDDVKRSLELGAVGVAVSSAIILAKDPKKEVLKLAGGF